MNRTSEKADRIQVGSIEVEIRGDGDVRLVSNYSPLSPIYVNVATLRQIVAAAEASERRAS